MLYTTKKTTECNIEELHRMIAEHALVPEDEITITLTDGREVALVVVDYPEGRGVILGFKECVAEHRMNPTWTNKGGYFESEMREWLKTDILPLLPEEIRAGIIPATIKQKHDSKEYVMNDLIWLASEEQMFGKTYWSASNEEKQLEYFKKPENRIKLYEGEAVWHWVRSPVRDLSRSFCCVDLDGDADGGGAGFSLGVAPLFIFA